MNEARYEPLSFSEQDPQSMQNTIDGFYNVMRKRRSVRDFSSRPVESEVINTAIRAAGTAPNGANLQPWHFAVIQSPKVKREIRLAAEKEEQAFYEHRAPDEWLQALAHLGTDASKPFLETAPCLIAVFSKTHSQTEDGGKQKNYYIQESVGLATGMLITGLHMAGLATLTHTPSPMGFLREILGRPKEERPFLLLVVGYPAEGVQVPVITKKPLEEITSYH